MFAFNHFNFNVTDLERSLAFYHEALGLEPVRRKEAADGSFTLTYLGFGGGNTVIQVRLWKSLYNITMRQAWVLTVFCGYLGNLFLGILTMLISAKTKSAAVAVSMPFIVIFIPVILQGTVDALSTFASFMPSTLLEFYQHLSTFDLVTVFGKVFRVADLCIPLYGLLTLILIPILYREYRTKQIV